MHVGFRSPLVPLNRRYIVSQLRAAIDWARQIGFTVIEFPCTEDMSALGLDAVFDTDFLDVLRSTRDIRFHGHVLFGERSIDEVGTSDTHPSARAAYMRKLYEAIDFFERKRPLQLYVLEAGPKIVDAPTHLGSLFQSLDCLRTLYPHIPMGLRNGPPGTLLSHARECLDVLDGFANVSLVFDTGWAYQAVGYSRELFERTVRSLVRFADRIASIHWRNLGPGTRSQVPLHIPIERGLDLALVARHLGRNPALVHCIQSTACQDQVLLARDRRALLRLLNAA
jgi:hypothetical protein